MNVIRKILISCAFVSFAFLSACRSAKPTAVSQNANLRARRIVDFDHDWRFLKADAAGAENSEFDDSNWRKLDVPHDWSIEGPFSETNKTGGAGGFLPAGIGWYRKHFSLPEEDSGRRVSVEFDGVMANSDVWINGHHLGKRPYGYVSFSYELTPYLNFGARPNVIAVRADNSQQPASRWYAGAGIYRHVRLVVTDPVHIKHWGTFVTTPHASAEETVVHIESTVTNQSDSPREISMRFSLRDPDGKSAGNAETKTQVVPAGQSATFTQEISVKNPRRWSLKNPVLYQVNSEVRAGNEILDDEKTSFGIRHFEFRSDTGFWLNGKNFKIYGVCLHSEASAFGAAVPLGVWERRLSELKKLGVNAIRTAHNPPAPEFLDLCDRMGFLVMDEFFDCWTVGKNSYDYHLYFDEWSKTDARDTILRDRNHPSIILYSVGNEIHDTPKAELAKRILKGLVEVCHENDPTRPVTQALFRPNVSHDYDDGLADMLDVIGTNYRDNELLAAQREKPSRKIIGTEQRQDRQTWLWLRDNPSHSGQFLWSGIDYLGESRRWPVVAAGSGLLERTATPRPLAFERQSWWSEKPMVFMTRRVARSAEIPADPGFNPLDRRQVLFPDWTPRNSAAHEENVEVYSNCREVELFLNGKSLGAKTIHADASPRNWEVPFEPGTLKAIGKNDDKAVAEFELRTAGEPAKIVLKTESKTLAPGFDNVAFVSAEVVDENGILIPHANDLITFNISGPGMIAAVDSANNASHESFQAKQRRAFQGRCFAILKATGANGKIILTASAPGLKSSTITIPTIRAGE
ncbi:MAG TPA: glycoside hydrolase family 2 TIM barrel-domain containing protein [Verrucomicrobiae bacterium]|nr:glycoside hydrolase family 2 TIM barrel-domain containing protein [Verrucomicrobiae bacterium]